MNGGSPSSGSSQSIQNEGGGSQAPVSARKLATALWEVMNKIPPPERQGRGLKQESRGRNSVASPDLERTRMIPVVGRRKYQYEELIHGGMDLRSSGSLMETDAHSQGPIATNLVVGTRSCLKDLHNNLMTSKEILKLLGRIWGLKETHKPANSLVSTLREEVDRACVHVDQLIQEHRTDRNTLNIIKKQFTEEMSSWKSKEEQRIRYALRSIMEELESEKLLRRRSERMNKNLGIELARMRASFVKAVKEIKDERRSREIIEQVCNELVRGIGEDKFKVEELKRESAKFQEELEKEREMLQVADELREERVQMKLLEAKYQFEEKNAAVDRLRNELEAYLTAKNTSGIVSLCGDFSGRLEGDNHSQLVHPRKSCRVVNLSVSESNEARKHEGSDGEGDEMGSERSIELQEEQEQENEMIQIAEWREEKNQMKASKAKSQFVERNAAVDRLRSQLEAYMLKKRTEDRIGRHEDLPGLLDVEKHTPMVRHTANNLIINEGKEVGELEDSDEVDDGTDSVNSDLHSIELNVDSSSKSYSWSYAAAATKYGTKSELLAEEKIGRIMSYDHIPRRGMCLNNTTHHLHDDERDQEILSGSSKIPESQARKLDHERYTSVEGLRDQILAASMISLPGGSASPTHSRDIIGQVCEGLNIGEMVKAARENGQRARRNNTCSQFDPIQ